MNYQGFISTVQEGAHIPADEAERVACTTLHALAERISTGEAEDLRERLPGELRECLTPEGPHDPFHVDEFLRRISERAGVDESAAQRDARAVFAALWQAVGPEEFADMRSELPKDFEPLFDEAIAEERRFSAQPGSAASVSFDEFLEKIMERTHLDRLRAQRAAEAVLEVLASRITGGELDDLEAELPVELLPAMERGRARSGGRARPLSREQFEREIAEIEGVSRSEAVPHARAVFNTLREVLTEKEWSDMRAQLPDEYRPLMRTEE